MSILVPVCPSSFVVLQLSRYTVPMQASHPQLLQPPVRSQRQGEATQPAGKLLIFLGLFSILRHRRTFASRQASDKTEKASANTISMPR